MSLHATEATQHLDHLVRGATGAFGPLYFATFCALSVTLGALLYNLTGVLNEYFEIQQRLTNKPEERALLYGVDVSRSSMFKQPRVRAAVEFAAAAHAGQTRKTGEPYVSHCIETALIVEANLPHWRHDSRHETAVIAALLHDVLDDTATTPEQITGAFGPAVSAMVVKISKLSQVNQMLRRDKRKGVVSGDASYWQSQWQRLKRMMFEAVVEEPLVILVKLADRLHNMRTVYALAPAKQQAVAEETLAVWCSMAGSLGWHGLKSEMEDLCFAVTDTATFCSLRQQLDKLWSSPPPPRSRRRVRSSPRQQQLRALAQQQQELAAARAWAWEENVGQGLRDLRSLLGFVRLPMRLLKGMRQPVPAAAAAAEDSEQQQQSDVSANAQPNSSSSSSSSNLHAAALQQQQQQRNAGLDLLSRVWQQSDAAAATPLLPAPPEGDSEEPQRASGGDWGVTDAALSLRTLLGSSRWAAGLQPAPPQQQQQPKQRAPQPLTAQQQQLLSVLSTVVAFDAVSLKGNRGLTWSAQQGLRVLEEAASRLYMELAVGSFSCGLQVEVQGRLKSLRSVHSKMQRKACSVEEVYDARALRVVVDDGGGSRLADAVQCCYRLISAVHKLWHPIHGEFDDYIANPKPSGYQALHTAVWGPGGAALEELLQYAESAGWERPGQGDWHARLEEFEWCRDGRWHRRDHMGYLHPHTTLTLLEGYERDAAEAAAAEAACTAAVAAAAAKTAAALRSVIEWGVEAYGVEEGNGTGGGDVSVVIWPGGVIEDVPRGTTAGEILREKGVLAILADDEASSSSSSSDSDAEPADLAARSSSSRKQQQAQRSSSGVVQLARAAAAEPPGMQQQQQVRLVNVNNRLVSEDTVLSDGDLVILARERIKI
ncbi:hypothetical protein OEZ86_013411 [Tetradesmus obliquus]|nr:hypothetical protein OEZ86_013411 [Tetradesmus obliquus]